MTIPSAQQLAPTVTEITRSCAWDSLKNIMDPYSLIGITSGLYQLLWTAHDSRLLWLGSNEGPSPLVIVTDTSSWVISHFKLPWWIPITCGALLWTMGDYHSLVWTISNYYTLVWITSDYYDLWLGIDSILDLLWLTTSNLYLVWWSSNNSCSLSWPSRVLYLMRSTTGASYSLLGIPYFTTRFLSVFHYILSVPPYIELMERLASSIESTILLRLLLVSDLERDDLSNFIKSYRSRFSLRRPQGLNNPESSAPKSRDLLFLECEPRCPGELALSPVVPQVTVPLLVVPQVVVPRSVVSQVAVSLSVVPQVAVPLSVVSQVTVPLSVVSQVTVPMSVIPKVAVPLSVVLQVATSTPVDPRIAPIQPVSPRASASQPVSPRVATPQHVVHMVAAPPQPCCPCEPDLLATVCYSSTNFNPSNLRVIYSRVQPSKTLIDMYFSTMTAMVQILLSLGLFQYSNFIGPLSLQVLFWVSNLLSDFAILINAYPLVHPNLCCDYDDAGLVTPSLFFGLQPLYVASF